MSSTILAIRSLRRTPGFAAAAIATLSVGIGATVAIFTVLNAVLLRPLPYRQPERLAGAWFSLPGMGFPVAPQSLSSYFTYRKLARTIDGIALADQTAINLSDPHSQAAPQRVRAAQVTASLFAVLGVSVERGRNFTDADDRPHSTPVAIISDGLWHRQFGGDPGIIGRGVQLDGQLTDIIGIAPATLHYPNTNTDLWVPIGLDPAAQFGGVFGHNAIIRLRPGVTAAAAQREFTSLIPRIAEMYPAIGPGQSTGEFFTSARAAAQIHPLRNDVIGNFGSVVGIAGGAGLLLLLIAIANVASLLIARAEGRQRELAVRAALGAGTWRLVRQFLVESLVLASVGAVGGIILATLGIRAFVRFGPVGVPRLAEIHVDAITMLFAAALAMVIAVVCSTLMVMRHDTRQLNSQLRDGARGGTIGRDRQRTRGALVISQVAFATMLVGGACLLLHSFQRLRQVKPGFDLGHTLTLWLSLPTATYADDSAVVQVTSRLLDRLRTVPGASAVGASSKVPLNGIGTVYTPVWSDVDRSATNTLPPAEQVITATGGYFEAMGIPLIAGRTFDEPGHQLPYEAIIDRSLARQYWHDSTGRTAIGRKLRVTQDLWYTVVGVVGAVHDTALAAPANGLIYFPDVVAPDPNNSAVTRVVAITLQTRGNPHALVKSAERALADVDPSLPPFGVASMNDVAQQSLVRLSFVMTILGVTAGVALLLALIGLYGVLAYMVSLRTREIGVRMALGALPTTIARLVARQGLGLAGAGVVLGVAGFVGGVHFLHAFVYGLGGADPVTLAAVILVLSTVVVAASWIPARRAASVDPARALGAE